MTIPDVLRADEVLLNGGRYRLASPIAVRDVSPFPAKQVSGDFSKDSQQLRSVDVANDFGGGALLRHMDADAGVDRWWDSTLETRQHKELRLRARAIPVVQDSFPNGGSYTGFAPIALADYIYNSAFVSERLFVLYRGIDPSTPGTYRLRVGKWGGAPLNRFAQSLPSADEPTSVLEFNVFTQVDVGGTAYLLVGHNNGYAYYRPTAVPQWTVHNAGSGYPGMTHGVNWDKRFWMLHYGDHILKVTTDLETWTVRATLPYRLGPLSDLVVTYNQSQEPIITAVCEGGVWQYDALADTWMETSFQWPHFYKGGQSAITRQNKLAVGINSMLFEWDGQSARSIGLDRDYGMPANRRGAMTNLADAFSYLLATLDLRAGDPSTTPSIMAYDGVGWHTVWVAPAATSAPDSIGCVKMTSIVEETRLWFGFQTTMYYIEQQPGVFNPYQVADTEYEEDGYLIRPWFRTSWPADKLALSVEVEATLPTPDENISIEYALNDDEANWTVLGVVHQSGVTYFSFNAGYGVLWRSIRWRYVLRRGTVATNTPVLHSLVFTYKKVVPALYAFTFLLDLSQPYDGLEPEALYRRLTDAVASGPLIPLQLRQEGVEVVTAPVDITAFSVTTGAGPDTRASAQIACTTI